MATEVRKRATGPTPSEIPAPELAAGAALPDKSKNKNAAHPSGKEKHGQLMQVLRVVSFAVYFTAGCIAYEHPSSLRSEALTMIDISHADHILLFAASTSRNFSVHPFIGSTETSTMPTWL